MDYVAVRLQRLPMVDQVLALGRLAELRSGSGRFAPGAIEVLFGELGLPQPGKISNVLAKLESAGEVSRLKGTRGSWRLSPVGLERSLSMVDGLELAALAAEAASQRAPRFGETVHPVIPPSLAPPDLLGPLRQFLSVQPFDLNVFGMTRFPEEGEEGDPDPIQGSLDLARSVCAAHGLMFHLASDRMIVDDLWANVAAHMWACRFGIAFFEDRRGKGINYNLTIEVGGMLMSGRRLALLKDASIERLPTDLVGRIYKAVDLAETSSSGVAIHRWLRDDLGLGPCADCRE